MAGKREEKKRNENENADEKRKRNEKTNQETANEKTKRNEIEFFVFRFGFRFTLGLVLQVPMV